MKRLRKFFLRYKTILLLLILNLVLILFTFKDLPKTFYQQDEWMGLGRVKGYGLRFLVTDYSFLETLSAKGRFLARPISYLFYRFFPLQITPFVVFSLTLHFLNSLLVFLLAQKLVKKILVSVTASTFFATATVGRQAVTWAGANTATLPAATFILLSLIFYLDFLDSRKSKSLYLSQILAIISLFFKEAGLFLYLVFPFLYFAYKKRSSAKEFIKLHWAFLLFGVFIITARFFDLFFITKEPGGLFVTGRANPVGKILLRAILYPLTSLSQLFLPDNFIFPLAKQIGQIQYPFLAESPLRALAYESVISDMVSLFFSFCILLLFLFIVQKKREKKVALFALVLSLTSVLPFIILDRGNAYLESRYFYLSVAGGAILLGLFIEKLKNRLGLVFAILLLVLYLSWQISLTQTDVQRQVTFAQERKAFLSTLKKLRPTLPQKPIFYVSGDDDYFIADNKVPFQQGVGYTLMVFYYDTGAIPEKLLQENYLWKMLDQGYKEVNGQGFGYFWDKERLQEEFAKNEKLTSEQVIGFYYFGYDEQRLVKITDEIRKFLRP